MAPPVGSPPNPGLSRAGPFSPEYLGHYVHLLDKSPKMRAVRAIIDEVAPTDATVLLRGESGVGKGVVARALHAASRRHAQPFVKVNCAALPGELLEIGGDFPVRQDRGDRLRYTPVIPRALGDPQVLRRNLPE